MAHVRSPRGRESKAAVARSRGARPYSRGTRPDAVLCYPRVDSSLVYLPTQSAELRRVTVSRRTSRADVYTVYYKCSCGMARR